MKKILLFSRDPGGANTIIPLIEPLQSQGFDVKLYGKDSALDKYRQYGFLGENILDKINGITVQELSSFLVREKPDVIVTGTSEDDMTEKYLWKAAEVLGITSYVILDQWTNYARRFSTHTSPNDLFYMPSKICVMDEYAQQEMIKTGIDAHRIIVTGQPYFDLVQKIKNSFSADALMIVKKSFNIMPTDFVITYASEPIQSICGEAYWGYTEHSIFTHLLQSLEKVIGMSEKKIMLIIKIHPKENIDNFDILIEEFKHPSINIVIDKKTRQWDIMMISDLVCGMSSMFLLESVLLGVPMLSIQIGLKRENPFILDRLGAVKSIVQQNHLVEALQKIVLEGQFPQSQFTVLPNATDRVIHQIGRVCQN